MLPLYLFPEHWSIAKIRAQPIYGLISALDYKQSSQKQEFVLQYKVLMKTLEQVALSPTDENKYLLKIVLETC